MGHTLPVYAVAALLIAASAGPASQAVRDASLADFESLDEWRSLDEFPFLKQVEPYLPPLVVDWIIIQRDTPRGIPAGVDYRFDDKGRVLLVFPNGCEETQEQYETGSRCAPPDDPCGADPTAPGCDPCADPANATAEAACPPPECPPGEVLDPDWPDAQPACVPDPACTGPDENGTQPAYCPPPPEPPRPTCGNGTVAAYDGTCVPIRDTLLLNKPIDSPYQPSYRYPIQLKVAFANLSLEVRWSGLTSPGYGIQLQGPDGALVCWVERGSGAGDDCVARRDPGVGGGGARYVDAGPAPIPYGNYSLLVEPSQATGSTSGERLDIRVYGKPAEANDADHA